MPPKRILVAALDWGLGHGAQAVPIVRALEENGYEAVVAAAGRAKHFLSREFPEKEILEAPPYNIRYSRKRGALSALGWQTVRIANSIRKEHELMDVWIEKHGLAGVISLNCYGFWSRRIPCALVVHQLSPRVALFQGLLRRIVSRYGNRFDQCWLLDDEDRRLTGDLSNSSLYSTQVIPIGILSRFSPEPGAGDIKYDVVIIISGPEPSRSVMQEKMINEIRGSRLRVLVVLGKPEQSVGRVNATSMIVSHLSTEDLNQALIGAGLVIARPGYSTIMDLSVLGARAVFIPTPGQPEQEYLAARLDEQRTAPSMTLEEFTLEEAEKRASQYDGFRAATGGGPPWSELFGLFA